MAQQRRRRGERLALIRSWKQSGLSLRAWAKRRGINYQTALRWRKELERDAAAVSLVPVAVLDDSPREVPLEIALPCGMTLRLTPGFDATAAARLLRELQRC